MSNISSDIQSGRLNLISDSDRSEIKYIYVPKGYFKKINFSNDKKVSKIFDALEIDKPDMLFKVPNSSYPSEFFTHDISNTFEESFLDYIDKYKIKKEHFDLSHIDKNYKNSDGDIIWTHSFNKYLISELKKIKENLDTSQKNQLKEIIKFLKKLESIELDRASTKIKLKMLIRSLSEVFNQANAILWMNSYRNDHGGEFVASNCHKSTTILGDCVLYEEFFYDSSKINIAIENYINSNDKRIQLSSKFFQKKMLDKIIENSKSYYENQSESIDIVVEDVIKDINNIAKEFFDNSNNIEKYGDNERFKELKLDIENNKDILVRNTLYYDHISKFHMLPKSSLTHLIYWQDESDYLTWSSYLKSYFPVGVLLIGCKKTGYNQAIACLREKLPLFVFDKTGGSASIISKNFNKYNVNVNNINDVSDNDNQDIKIKQKNKFNGYGEFFEEIESKSKLIFENWFKYNKMDSVFVINPNEKNLVYLQDKIYKTMNTVFYNDTEIGSDKDDKIRLSYAWIQYETLKKNAKSLEKWSLFYFITIGILSFLTSLVSTLYTLYNNRIMGIFSIILPIITGLSLTLFYTFKPIQRWATSEIGRRMIIGEIFKYRTRTGIYHISKKFIDKKNKERKARELFSEELIKIWKNLELSDFKLSSLRTISNHKFEEVIKKIKDKENNLFDNKPYNLDLENGLPINNKTDPLEKISVDDYVNLRLDHLINKNKKNAPKYEFFLKLFQFLIFLFTASGAFLSHINLSIWVPIVLAFSTMLSTIMEQEQLMVKLSSTNGIYMQLEQLRCYWHGLCLVDKRKVSNANYIVENTESILISQLSSYVQAVKSVNEKDDD